MLCVSAAKSYIPEAYFSASDGSKVSSQETLKVLGFNSDHPSVKVHVEITQKKFKNRVWSLRHLKRNGFSKPDLVRVYTSMV